MADVHMADVHMAEGPMADAYMADVHMADAHMADGNIHSLLTGGEHMAVCLSLQAAEPAAEMSADVG